MQLAAETLKHKIIGRSLSSITNWDTSKGEDGKPKYGFATLWRDLCYGAQMKWCGPEKGPVHQAAAGIINAVWDLWAKHEGKPVWQLVADMPNEELIGCLDFRCVLNLRSIFCLFGRMCSPLPCLFRFLSFGLLCVCFPWFCGFGFEWELCRVASRRRSR